MAGFEEYDEQLATIRINEIQDRLENSELTNEVLREAYSDAVRQMFAMEDVGWSRLGGTGQVGPGQNLQEAKAVAAKLEEITPSNALLRSGILVKCGYLFSDPYEIGTQDAKGDLTAQQRNIIARPENQEEVFGPAALERIENRHYNAGIAFILFDKDTKTFQQIPFDEIDDIIYDPLNRGKLRYVKRVVTYDTVDARTGVKIPKTFKMWYPVSDYTPNTPQERFFRKIGDTRVDLGKRMVVSRVNRPTGAVFGIPDAFAAAPWALAYSAYLRDGTKVLAALAEWVWKFTPKKRPAAERAAAAVRTERGTAGSLFTDMDVQALPKADAVDLTTGRPLASQAAAALGISVVTLMSDPGQSGAYGTAQTLSDPNRRTMLARRQVITDVLCECLRLLNVKDPAVIWGKIAPGTDKEEMDLVAVAWGTGLFEPDEIRPRAADIAQITLTSDTAPEGIMIPNNSDTLQKQTDIQTPNPDGSNAMTNGVGRDNLGAGALSRSKTSKTQKGAEK
jgi:hypothetical protein